MTIVAASSSGIASASIVGMGDRFDTSGKSIPPILHGESKLNCELASLIDPEEVLLETSLVLLAVGDGLEPCGMHALEFPFYDAITQGWQLDAETFNLGMPG